MADLPDTVRAMIDEMMAPTAPLDDFLAAEREDSNLWWRIECGHHQNLLDEAVDRLEQERALANELADVLTHMVVGWKERLGVDLAEHPSVVAVMGKYREARGRA